MKWNLLIVILYFDINKGGNFLRMGMKFAQYKNKKHQKIHKP